VEPITLDSTVSFKIFLTDLRLKLNPDLTLPSSSGSGMVFENMMVLWKPVELRMGIFKLKCLIFAPRVKHHLDSRAA